MSKHLPCQEGQLVQVLPLVLGQARHSTHSMSVITQITTISMYPFLSGSPYLLHKITET
jgi:hypothetical protein